MDERIKMILNSPDENGECEAIKLELEGLTDEIDARLNEIDDTLFELDEKIDKLTNHADKFDYAIAISSGVITGLLDVFFEDFLKKKFDKYVNEQVILQASKQKIKKVLDGKAKHTEEILKKQREKIVKSVEEEFFIKKGKIVCSSEEEDELLKKAIRFLEKNNFSNTDNLWKGEKIGVNASSHHIDDPTHHASFTGLFISIISQITGKGYFYNSKGEKYTIKFREKSGESLLKNIAIGFVNWFGHLSSDIAGTSKNAGAGMGVPGPIMSLAKRFSSLPVVAKTQLPKIVDELFENGMDFRREASQSILVILNETIIRIIYAIRQLIKEFRETKNLLDIKWKNIIPVGDRTVERMMTFSAISFSVIDLIGAAGEGLLDKFKGESFLGGFLIHINLPGLQKCKVAIKTEIAMELTKNKREKEKLKLKNEALYLMGAKLYRGEELLWVAVKDAEESIASLYAVADKLLPQVSEDLRKTEESIFAIERIDKSEIESKNVGLLDDVLDGLN